MQVLPMWGFDLLPGDRVRHLDHPGWNGTVVESRREADLTVSWDDGSVMYDPQLGDRIASSTWDLLSTPNVPLAAIAP